MAFLAVKIPKRDGLERWFNLLKEEFKDLNLHWEHIDDLHLTLKFIAGLNDDEIDLLVEKLDNYKFNTEPFTLKTNRLRSFENEGEQGVLWLSVENSELQKPSSKRVEVIFEAIGFMPSRFDFVPHITLARYNKDIKETGIFSESFFWKL